MFLNHPNCYNSCHYEPTPQFHQRQGTGGKPPYSKRRSKSWYCPCTSPPRQVWGCFKFKWSLQVEPFPLTLVCQVANLQRRLQFQQCLQSKSFWPLFAPNLSCLNLICPSQPNRSEMLKVEVPHKDTFDWPISRRWFASLCLPTVPVFHCQGTLCSRKTMRAELQRPFTCASGMFTNFPGLPPFTSKHLSTMSFQVTSWQKQEDNDFGRWGELYMYKVSILKFKTYNHIENIFTEFNENRRFEFWAFWPGSGQIEDIQSKTYKKWLRKCT